MRAKNIEIGTGNQYGKLTTKWYWDTPSGRIWKCDCKCGATCYVRERALRLHIVGGCPVCDAEAFQAKKDYRKTLPKHRKRKKREVPNEE